MTTTIKAHTAAQVMAAADRCKARGVSTLYPTVWEAAMREELGVTAEESDAIHAAARAAADARLARGERALHDLKVLAAKGER